MPDLLEHLLHLEDICLRVAFELFETITSTSGSPFLRMMPSGPGVQPELAQQDRAL